MKELFHYYWSVLWTSVPSVQQHMCVCVKRLKPKTHRGERMHIFTIVYERSTRITFQIVTNWLNAYNATFSTTSTLQHPAELFPSGFWHIFHQAEWIGFSNTNIYMTPSHQNKRKVDHRKPHKTKHVYGCRVPIYRRTHSISSCSIKIYRTKSICTPEDNQLGRNVIYINIYTRIYMK
jgi:hypothetical protein